MVRLLPVRWSRKALETLDEGLSYIAHFNPDAAHQLRLSIFSAIDHIRAFPQSARMVPEEEDPRLREFLREPFRIIYEVHSREIRILVVRRMEREPVKSQDLI